MSFPNTQDDVYHSRTNLLRKLALTGTRPDFSHYNYKDRNRDEYTSQSPFVPTGEEYPSIRS